MTEFFNVLPSGDALAALMARLRHRTGTEFVHTAEVLGRVTAKEVTSPEDLPAFPRSAMDGYSVRAADTFGATEGQPAYLTVVGEAPMGREPAVCIGTGEAARTYTGGMLANGGDAVLMVEHSQVVDDRTIEVLRPVAPGENVIQRGEDVLAGSRVLPAGHRLRPQDVGGLMALGMTAVGVTVRPRVCIVSTGDELVPPDAEPGPGQVRDVNTYTVAGLVEEAGGVPVPVGLVADDYEAQRRAAQDGLVRGDALVFSAGSSVSSRDMTAEVIASLGEPGVLVHGLAHKPGKPTIVALVDGKPVFGLPGNPVSAMVVFDLLVRPTIYALSGLTNPPPPGAVSARLTRDLPSQAGREDHVQVKLVRRDGVLYAEPSFGKSNLIYTMVRADGTVVVPLDRGGLYAGEDVEVGTF